MGRGFKRQSCAVVRAFHRLEWGGRELSHVACAPIFRSRRSTHKSLCRPSPRASRPHRRSRRRARRRPFRCPLRRPLRRSRRRARRRPFRCPLRHPPRCPLEARAGCCCFQPAARSLVCGCVFVVVMASSVVRTHTNTHTRGTLIIRAAVWAPANWARQQTKGNARPLFPVQPRANRSPPGGGNRLHDAGHSSLAVAASAAPHALSNPEPC